MTQGELGTKSRRRRRFGVIDAIAVLMLVVGVSFVGYYAWEFYGTGVVTQKAVDEEKQDLRQQWELPEQTSTATPDPGASPGPGPADPTPSLDPQAATQAPTRGKAAWLIRIPRLGADYEWPIVAGIETDDLARGVGWFPDSALPGQIGNFALAGHRVTHGEPFRNLLNLRVGDEVVIETRDAIYTYKMTSAPKDLTVNFTDSWVLDPVPGKPGVAPTQAIITLTTCQSFFHTPDRSVGFGVLESTVLK